MKKLTTIITSIISVSVFFISSDQATAGVLSGIRNRLTVGRTSRAPVANEPIRQQRPQAPASIATEEFNANSTEATKSAPVPTLVSKNPLAPTPPPSRIAPKAPPSYQPSNTLANQLSSNPSVTDLDRMYTAKELIARANIIAAMTPSGTGDWTEEMIKYLSAILYKIPYTEDIHLGEDSPFTKSVTKEYEMLLTEWKSTQDPARKAEIEQILVRLTKSLVNYVFVLCSHDNVVWFVYWIDVTRIFFTDISEIIGDILKSIPCTSRVMAPLLQNIKGAIACNMSAGTKQFLEQQFNRLEMLINAIKDEATSQSGYGGPLFKPGPKYRKDKILIGMVDIPRGPWGNYRKKWRGLSGKLPKVERVLRVCNYASPQWFQEVKDCENIRAYRHLSKLIDELGQCMRRNIPFYDDYYRSFKGVVQLIKEFSEASDSHIGLTQNLLNRIIPLWMQMWTQTNGTAQGAEMSPGRIADIEEINNLIREIHKNVTQRLRFQQDLRTEWPER